jgi:hypothetical protein
MFVCLFLMHYSLVVLFRLFYGLLVLHCVMNLDINVLIFLSLFVFVCSLGVLLLLCRFEAVIHFAGKSMAARAQQPPHVGGPVWVGPAVPAPTTTASLVGRLRGVRYLLLLPAEGGLVR